MGTVSNKQEEKKRINCHLRPNDFGLVELLPEIIFQVYTHIGVYDEYINIPPGLRSTVRVCDAHGKPISHDQDDDTSELTIGPRIGRDDRTAATDFAQRIRTRFERDAPYFLLAAATLFKRVVMEIETTGKLSREDAAEALVYPLTILRLVLEEYVGINKPTKRNGRNKWARVELSQAVHEAALGLPKAERTYANIAAHIQEKEPTRAPASGEALRKLCERLGVKTKLIKRGGKRTPKIKSV
ncbi:MAG: hypothetical protein WBP93_05380 [Pyrinomonadaceae bacterium]